MLYADAAWRQHLIELLRLGQPVAPRGQATLEVLHERRVSINTRSPVVTSIARKLNYQFMCAEALWILHGDDRVEPLARFIKRMVEFSDDGLHLAGAYGPRIMPQVPFVVEALCHEPCTRQAALTIWTPSPEPSKDIPCTIGLVFTARGDRLHAHVYMRSSDAWLGVPYDLFSFSMLLTHVCCLVNERASLGLYPGQLSISMTSAHIYQRDVERAGVVLASHEQREAPLLPVEPVLDGDWDAIEAALVARREQVDEPTVWRVVE